MMADASHNETDNTKNDKCHQEEEPDGTQDNIFADCRNFIIVVNSLLHLYYAKGREIIYIAGDISGSFWHDYFGEMIVLIFVGGEDFFAGDGIRNAKGNNGCFVDIAVVVY